MALPELPMYCRACRYPIVGLSAPRCPECGTPFDPADPTTFRYSVRRPKPLLRWEDLAGSLLNAGAIGILLLDGATPRMVSGREGLSETLFCDSLVWLAVMLSAASVVWAAWWESSWKVQMRRVAVLAFGLFLVSRTIADVNSKSVHDAAPAATTTVIPQGARSGHRPRGDAGRPYGIHPPAIHQ